MISPSNQDGIKKRKTVSVDVRKNHYRDKGDSIAGARHARNIIYYMAHAVVMRITLILCSCVDVPCNNNRSARKCINTKGD